MTLTPEHIIAAANYENLSLEDWLREPNRPQVDTIHYSSEGWNIEAILVAPPNWDKKSKLPMLTYLHGGPERRNELSLQCLGSANAESAALFLACHGYLVFLPNFRGSSGYGEEFMNELQDYQLMKKPFRDVMTGIEVLASRGIVDTTRMGIYGSSYGAQLGAWAIAHTTQFKAAILALGRYDTLVLDRCSGRAFHSLKQNRQGDSDALLDMWFKPGVYRDLSPMQHVESIRTPAMLIETGAERKDLQARMMFNALQAFGVESYWIWYPEAFHQGRWNDGYRKDYMQRLLAWWNHHLNGDELPELFGEKEITIETD